MKKCYSVLLLIIIGIASCKKDDKVITATEARVPVILSQEIILNPSGFAPLTAKIELKTDIPSIVSIKVVGKNGSASDVVKHFSEIDTMHSITVLGLYASYSNAVEINLTDANGENPSSAVVNIQTAPLISALPAIGINTSLGGKVPGMTLVSYFGYSSNPGIKTPFIFDEFGDIRWFLDYTSDSILNTLNYEDGIERLKNGNLYFGDDNSGAIYEINMLGEILNTWPLPGYDFHHHVLEKPNGNFIASVNKQGLSTIEDFVIEVDRNSHQIINEWDLRQSMQQNRTAWTTNTVDWMHVNALAYDDSDNTIIVSGRTQGVVKLDANNNVKWILAPHKDWGIAGNGVDLSTKLLQPLDVNGNPISDNDVLIGNTNHADFEWNWYQHAIKKMPNGDWSLFDNGDNRNYTSSGPYSRAVEYKIDPVNMTVQQIWQYGKQRGAETYSRIVSDVDFHGGQNHFIFSPGAISYNNKYAKIIEIDKASSAVLFEATIYPPTLFSGGVTLHRSERMSLYP